MLCERFQLVKMRVDRVQKVKVAWAVYIVRNGDVGVEKNEREWRGRRDGGREGRGRE